MAFRIFRAVSGAACRQGPARYRAASRPAVRYFSKESASRAAVATVTMSDSVSWSWGGSAAVAVALGAAAFEDELREMADLPKSTNIAACEGLSEPVKALIVAGLFGGAYLANQTAANEVEFSEVELWIAYNQFGKKSTKTRQALLQFHAENPEFLKQVGIADANTDTSGRIDTLIDYETQRVATQSEKASFSNWCSDLSAAGLKIRGSGIRASQSNLKAMFTALDVDSNGTLDTEEFVQFGLWACPVVCGLVIETIQGRSIPQDVLDDMIGDSFNRDFFLDKFLTWDRDGSGTIDYFEFVLFWRSITQSIVDTFMKTIPNNKANIDPDNIFAILNKYLSNILRSTRP